MFRDTIDLMTCVDDEAGLNSITVSVSEGPDTSRIVPRQVGLALDLDGVEFPVFLEEQIHFRPASACSRLSMCRVRYFMSFYPKLPCSIVP